MDSLINLYRIGHGPSSSHTMGPVFAVQDARNNYPNATEFEVELYDSLAKTGKGHLTDRAIIDELAPLKVRLIWSPEKQCNEHPNVLVITPLDASQKPLAPPTTYFSIGGGTIRKSGVDSQLEKQCYTQQKMDEILAWCEERGEPIWQLVKQTEKDDVWKHLYKVWHVMNQSINDGLEKEGTLEGGLKLKRRAHAWNLRAKRSTPLFQKNIILASYALAVGEQNASAGVIVTAPTCGAAGVLPAVLRAMIEFYDIPEKEVIRALATAGIVGNLIKHNASISGAEAGCQAEIGAACSMAAAAAAQLLGATPRQIEYAAEMGLEHHLGLTCDPVNGLVQIPCIERNAFAAMRALGCAEFAVISDGSHRISFDDCVESLRQTGLDMCAKYRETSEGGLAKVCHGHCC